MSQGDLEERFGRDYPAGTVLFRQGDRGQHMYVIRSGKVQISRSIGGQDTPLAVLPPGEFFGEMSLITNAPRSATVRVIEDARLLQIDTRTFEAMIHHNAEIAVRLIQKLAARLAEANRQVELLMLRDPSSRVVHCLRQAAQSAGKPAAAGIAVDMDEAALAGRLGLAVDEVRPIVERLERARLIKRHEDGTFVVAEAGKLQDFLDFLEMKERYGEPS